MLKLKHGDTLRVGIVDGQPATATVAVSSEAEGLCLRWQPGMEETDEDTARRRLSDTPAAAASASEPTLANTSPAPPTPNPPPPPVRIDLLLAMPRPKVMTRLWAPLASTGVGAVYLTNAARVERCYFDSKALDKGKVEDELLRGLEQSGDTIMPGVCVVKRFPAAMDAVRGLSRVELAPGSGEAEGAAAARTVTTETGAGSRAVTRDDGGRCGGFGDEAGRSCDRWKEGTSWLIDSPASRHVNVNRSPVEGEDQQLQPPGELEEPGEPPVMLMAHPGVRTTLAEALAGAGEDTPGNATPRLNKPGRVIIAVGPEARKTKNGPRWGTKKKKQKKQKHLVRRFFIALATRPSSRIFPDRTVLLFVARLIASSRLPRAHPMVLITVDVRYTENSIHSICVKCL